MVINRNPEYFLTIAQERSISRAAEKLRSDSVAMGLLGMGVENAPPHS